MSLAGTAPTPTELAALAAELIRLTPAELSASMADASPEELAVISAALSVAETEHVIARDPTLGWRSNPATFAAFLTLGRIRLWPYSVLLAEKFSDAVNGRSRRQIWNLPRRYGKSMWASQWGPAWALDRDPTTKLILVSYGDRLAVTNAVAVRDILRDHREQTNTVLRRDRQESRQFATTMGGGVLAGGIMSALTGFGAHGVIFDDPFSNWQEAHSAARRNLVDNQYRSVVASGLETEEAFVIIPMTRWHEDDLVGRLTKRMEDATGEEFEVVRIPELAEEYDPTSHDPLLHVRDPLGRQPGQVIEEERYSLPAVKARHLSLGSYLTAALAQQRPSPEEGGELKRSWWKLETNLPVRYDQALSSWDMKLKDNESGDFVVGTVWGRTGKDCWCVDMFRGQWNQATAENAVALCAVRNSWLPLHLIEAAGYGPEVAEALRSPHPGYTVSADVAGQLGMTEEDRARVTALRRRGLPGVICKAPRGDKSARIRAVSGFIEAGDVHLPERAAWLGALLDETAAFPNGAHDDIVDSISQAVSRLLKGEARVSQRSAETLPPTMPARVSLPVHSLSPVGRHGHRYRGR